jgi:hypothetical protein
MVVQVQGAPETTFPSQCQTRGAPRSGQQRAVTIRKELTGIGAYNSNIYEGPHWTKIKTLKSPKTLKSLNLSKNDS